MGLTQSVAVKRNVPGARYETVTIVACDASYPNAGATVGYPLTAALLQLQELVDYAHVTDCCDVSADGYEGFIDPTSGNLRVMVSSTGVEVANAASLAGVKFRVRAVGV